MSNPTDTETISYPSIAIVLALGYVLYRYFFSSSPASTSSSSSTSRNNGLHFTPAQVDQVSAMFPQLSRRDIMWDLQRNRGSVQATIERVLGGRGLDPVSNARLCSSSNGRHALCLFACAAARQRALCREMGRMLTCYSTGASLLPAPHGLSTALCRTISIVDRAVPALGLQETRTRPDNAV